MIIPNANKLAYTAVEEQSGIVTLEISLATTY